MQRAKDRYLIFDCGPLGDGGHGHYDALSLEAWAGDRPLVMDPGRYTYAEGEPEPPPLVPRHRRPQHRQRRRARSDAIRAQPLLATERHSHLPGAHRHPDFDILEGRVQSPCYDAIHTRRVILVHERYWLVEDRLESTTSRRYDLRWHLPPEAYQLTRELAGGGAVAPGLTLIVHGARSVALEDGLDQPRVRQQAAGTGPERRQYRHQRPLPHAARPARAGRPRPHARARRRHADRRRRPDRPAMTLAPDPRVPRRDALLRPTTMAGVISQRLHEGVPVERVERAYVKYRVGESLRVVYRYALNDAVHHVAVRSGAKPHGTTAPEVGATLFPFPHDRRLAHLHALAPGSRDPRAPARPAGHATPGRPTPPSSPPPPSAATPAAT